MICDDSNQRGHFIQHHARTEYSAFSPQEGIVMLEAMIALLIFSMGVLAIVGLQASIAKNSTDAKFRAIANNVAQQQIGMMWTHPDPRSLVADLETNTPIPELLPNGTRSVTQPDKSLPRYLITVTWQLPDTPVRKLVTNAIISGG